MFDNIGNIIKNGIEKAEDMLTLEPLRKKLEEESEVFKTAGNVARMVDSAIGPKRLLDFAENPSIEKIGNSISKGKDLFLEGFNEEKNREEEEKASYRELFKPSTFLPPTPGFPKTEDIAEKVLRQRDNADDFLEGFKEASKDFSLEGIKDAAKTAIDSAKTTFSDTVENVKEKGFINGIGESLKEKGILDDVTKSFFNANNRDRNFSIKAFPTDDVHYIISNINYNENKKVDLSSYDKDKGYINDQGFGGAVDKLKYGFQSFAENGCEVIAINNALITLEDKKDIRDIARELENDGQVFFGAFGTDPYTAGEYFKKKGYSVETFTGDDTIYNLDIPDADTYILSYWNDGGLTEGIHTISINKAEGGKYRFYNAGDNRNNIAKSINEFLEKNGSVPLVLHCIKKG